MRAVAHCVSPYLHIAGSWIYAQISRLKRYRPVVLTQGAQNLEAYPIDALYSAEDLPAAKRLLNRAVRRLGSGYPFYGEPLRREGAALMHAHFGYEGCRCLRAKKSSGLPLLTTFYGADATEYARYPRWREHYQRLFEEGELFLAEGAHMGETLVAIGCPADKVRVWRLGVDVGRIAYHPRNFRDQVRFLICANFREKKGIPYALRALGQALAARPFPFSLTLVGDGQERPQIEALVDELGIREHVAFRGAIPYAQVLEELSRSDILLQTSVTAKNGDSEGGAPVILLDAQASGMPVVATHHADIPSYVRDGESGFLAPERDVEGLADCILRLVEAPAAWEGMGRAGRQHVEARYNAEVQVAELETIYDGLCSC